MDICSPPQNIADQSGLHLFRPIAADIKPPSIQQQNTPPQQNLGMATKLPHSNDFQQTNNLTFSIPETGATSTPAKPSQLQSKPTFGLPTTNTQPTKPAMTNLFGNKTGNVFGGNSFSLGGSKETPKPFISQQPAPVSVPPATTQQNNAPNIVKVSTEISQPFLTVQPNYKPPTQPTK